MRARLTTILVSIAVSLSAGAQPAFTQRPLASRPAIAASSNLVRVDAVVTDANGRAVRDLTAANFTVVEDDTAESVESAVFSAGNANSTAGDVAVVPVLSRSDEQTEAARPGAHLFAIFMDEYHVDAGEETDRARELAEQFIEHSVGPGDLAIVVKPLDSLLNLRMTHDRDALLAALSTFEGRNGDLQPRNEFEQNYFAAAPQRVEELRSQIVASALNALVIHLGSLQPGRKTLIMVSDGFPRPPQRRDQSLPTIESIARTANRHHVSIYALAPSAVAPSTADAASSAGTHDLSDALKALTSQTDGRAALTASDAAALVPRIASEASGYYMLSFHPAHPGDARTYHTVEVRVNRPRLTVHARSGYWAADAEDVRRSAAARFVPAAPPMLPVHHVSPLILPWFGVARARANKPSPSGPDMQVSFVWEPVPPVPGDRVRTGPPAMISLKATRVSDGAIVFQGQAAPSTDAAADAPRELRFDTAPGRLLLELRIEDADKNVLDTDVRDVIVGALAGKVEVGTPLVYRAENARAFRDIEHHADATPAATRAFRREDHLLLRIPVYGGSAPVTVSIALGARPGSAVMRTLPATALADGRTYQADLSLANLATGDYVLTVEASSADGRATERVPFTVVP